MSSRRSKRASRSSGSRSKSTGAGGITIRQMYQDPYRVTSKTRMHRGVPNCLEATCCYDELVSCTAGSGVVAGNSYRLNDLFDPRVESGGHQPTFFDQLMALYGSFVVMECEISLSANTSGYSETTGTTTANSNTPQIAVIAPYGTSTVPSSATSDVLEWPGAISRPLSAFQAKTVRQRFKLATMFGLRSESALRNNPDYWGSAGASPAIQWQALVGIGSLSGQGLATLVSVRVIYRTIFFNPKFPAISVPRPICYAVNPPEIEDYESPASDEDNPPPSKVVEETKVHQAPAPTPAPAHDSSRASNPRCKSTSNKVAAVVLVG